MSKQILILVGPSGSGKTTIGRELQRRGIPEVVSHTTREMRQGEKDGVSYYFVDKATFDAIEKIEEVEYAGNHYCVSKQEMEDKLAKNDVIFVITDINGVMQIKKRYPEEAKVIFIYAPVDVLRKRMEKRGDSEENINKRIQHLFDSGELDNDQYADLVVENRVLEQAVEEIFRFIKAGSGVLHEFVV